MKNYLSRVAAAGLLAILALVCAAPAFAVGASTIGTDVNGHSALRYMLTDEAITTGVGAKSGTGVTVAETGNSNIHITTWTLTNLSVTMTDATTNGSEGAQKIYTFPLGAITILGCYDNLTTLAGSGGLADTAALVSSLGSVVAAADDTLTSTEANIIASTAGTLAAGAGVMQNYGSMVAAAFNGTATASVIYLNFAVPDAGTSSNDTLTVNGTIQCRWYNIGDPTP